MSRISQNPAEALTESVYYARHFRLPGFSESVQGRLRSARVLVVGIGGLGCPAALYLAGAGVGSMTLCDADVVSASNLHRQALFDMSSIGKKKVDVAAARLRRHNPFVSIETMDAYADKAFLDAIVGRYDLVLDGTDNFSAKFAINDSCAKYGVPLVYGSISQFEGQVSVFHLRSASGELGYSYRDLFHGAPPANLAPNCEGAGVVGVLPGVIGALQAAEAIKVITGLGEPLSGQLLMYDALSSTTRKLALHRRTDSGFHRSEAGSDEISFAELQPLLRTDVAPTLIDVRDSSERDAGHVGGLHIPLSTLHSHLASIPATRDVVVYCKSGMRSAQAALYLRSVLPGIRVFNMVGGMDALAGGEFACPGASGPRPQGCPGSAHGP